VQNETDLNLTVEIEVQQFKIKGVAIHFILNAVQNEVWSLLSHVQKLKYKKSEALQNA